MSLKQSTFAIAFIAFIALIAVIALIPHATVHADSPFAIAIHGGAGTILRNNMPPERERAYRSKLEEAARAGHSILARGGTSLDAVQTAIEILEDSPLFNAGRGAVFTNAETNELDASIMDGKTLRAGAVASVSGVKNPIRLARRVMNETWHVLLVADGAENFALEQGMELRPPEYFRTERRLEELERAKAAERDSAAGKHGTVGAVALDKDGNLAAGTSTGGLTNKRFGRVGDSPIIGAGTYASNRTCAVSCTGQGEFFMRSLVAYDIAARMEYAGESLDTAAGTVIEKKLVELGGSGGAIAIDPRGKIAMRFNTPGMYRACCGADGRVEVRIWGE